MKGYKMNTITATELIKVYGRSLNSVVSLLENPPQNPLPWDKPEVALATMMETCGALASLLEKMTENDYIPYTLNDFTESFWEGVEMMDERLETAFDGEKFQIEC